MKPLDYTLYNKVKAKFRPLPDTMIFVSLGAENLEDLHGIVFQVSERRELGRLVHEHWENEIPYAAIGGFSEGDMSYSFCCKEFEQEEDLLTGQLIKSSLETYRSQSISIEEVKKDLRNLGNSIILTGNA